MYVLDIFIFTVCDITMNLCVNLIVRLLYVCLRSGYVAGKQRSNYLNAKNVKKMLVMSFKTADCKGLLFVESRSFRGYRFIDYVEEVI